MIDHLLHTPNWGPGMYPDWELNQRPFGLQAGTQSTELHQQGWKHTFKRSLFHKDSTSKKIPVAIFETRLILIIYHIILHKN